jgi:hypothetical protein
VDSDKALWLNIVSKKKKFYVLYLLFELSFLTFCKHRFPGNTLTHSTNEDLLNIKRKGDPEVSYPLNPKYIFYTIKSSLKLA